MLLHSVREFEVLTAMKIHIVVVLFVTLKQIGPNTQGQDGVKQLSLTGKTILPTNSGACPSFENVMLLMSVKEKMFLLNKSKEVRIKELYSTSVVGDNYVLLRNML